MAGLAALIIGMIGNSFGSAWNPQVYEFLFGFSIVESLDAFVPYFPMVPFYPILIMAFGASLIVKSRKRPR